MRATRLLTLLCLLAPTLAPAQTAQTAHSREGVPFSISHLSLALSVNYERATVAGRATLRIVNTAKSPQRHIPLLLGRLMAVSHVAGTKGAPLRFQQSVATFVDDSTMQLNAVVVDAGRAVAPGDSVTVVMQYGGVLVGYEETGSLYIKDHVDRAFTIIREDAYAFPRIGVPSHDANRSTVRTDFTFNARITVPTGLVVATGGEALQPTTRDSLVTWEFQSRTPVPFLNITIAPYKVMENKVARIYFFPQDSSGAAMLQTAVGAAMASLGRWYGLLDSAPQLVVMEIPEGFGSQASLVAGIIQTADAFRDRDQLRQVYHELSHLWNAPDLDVPSPRWNEGLASFLQWRLAADLDGWNDWDARLERSVRSLLDNCANSRSCQHTPMSQFGKSGLTDRSYVLAQLMFFALYETLGADTFDRAYATYYAGHRKSGGTTEDLANAFRAASTKSDPILSEWLFSTVWYARLTSGESFRQIVESYRR